MSKGKFITFEGTEGVGKSTQLSMLASYLEETGQRAVFLREPGGTPISEAIRTILLSTESVGMCSECEALLYAASRAQLVQQVIRPALDRGELVICDRYVHSSIAYQGYARQLGEEHIRTLNSYAIDTCSPDYVVFLDLPPEDGFNRKGGADSGDRIEQEKADFFRRVYDGFVEMSQASDTFIVIRPTGTKTETATRIREELISRGIIK